MKKKSNLPAPHTACSLLHSRTRKVNLFKYERAE